MTENADPKLATGGTAPPADGPPPSQAGQSSRTILAWVWSVFILFGSVGVLISGGFIPFILMAGVGLLAFPPLWQRLRARGTSIPVSVRVILSVILLVAYAMVAPHPGETSDMAGSNPASTDPSAPVATRLSTLESNIAPDAVSEMIRADFSDTYNKLGQAQFDKANALAKWAAIAAAESEQCPSVDLVGISDRATRETLQWYVDCGNKERFFINQEQAEAALAIYDPASTPEARATAERVAVAEPVSARWKDFDEASTVSACDLLVEQQMLVPSTFSTGFSRWAMDKNDETGVVVIERDYTSENAYGMEINGRYRCTVNADDGELVGLAIREPDGWVNLK